MSGLESRLVEFLADRAGEVSGYCLALSGGIDSTALLHALHSVLRTQTGIVCRAIHINHRLQVAADQWARHCESLCMRYGIDYAAHTVDARARPGESPEAAARHARYAAFAELLAENECLLTAQHQNDQAETLLLQLLRGAGAAGLAAMPPWTRFGRGLIARPWLECSRIEIEEYARACKLSWVEDSSNADPKYSRNYLRHRVMPVIEQHWPGAVKTLSRAARVQADADCILREAAVDDLETVQTADGGLAIAGLRQLSTARMRNVIRYWLQHRQLPMPSAAHVLQIEQACNAAVDSMACVRWPGAEVRRYRGTLYAMQPQADLRGRVIDWYVQESLLIPELSLQLDRADLVSAGINLAKADGFLQIRFRQGGETLQLPGRHHHHKLKKLLHERGVPVWRRDRLPLLYSGDTLVAVLGLQPPLIAADWVLS